MKDQIALLRSPVLIKMPWIVQAGEGTTLLTAKWYDIIVQPRAWMKS